HGASEGRLNNYKGKGLTDGVGAWCAKKTGNVTRYLEIDLGSPRQLSMIGTQGRNTTNNQFVSSYSVRYSSSGRIFSTLQGKKFPGNSDKNTVVWNALRGPGGGPLVAQYIRIYPLEFYANICMRVELKECAG
ncbi:unnamed protein product, partial [Porites evermanni]